jgi:hypothetical protein
MTKQTEKQQKTEIDQLMLFTLKREVLKTSVHLQTAPAAETHPAEKHWLKKQLNVVKVTYIPSRYMNDNCMKNRGAIFTANKNIY